MVALWVAAVLDKIANHPILIPSENPSGKFFNITLRNRTKTSFLSWGSCAMYSSGVAAVDLIDFGVLIF